MLALHFYCLWAINYFMLSERKCIKVLWKVIIAIKEMTAGRRTALGHAVWINITAFRLHVTIACIPRFAHRVDRFFTGLDIKAIILNFIKFCR